MVYDMVYDICIWYYDVDYLSKFSNLLKNTDNLPYKTIEMQIETWQLDKDLLSLRTDTNQYGGNHKHIIIYDIIYGMT